jgi:hypothetical protein
VDDKTNFGLTLLESLRCGGVVLAKVPDNPSDWMINNGELTDSVLWFENLDDVSDMLSSVVRSWTTDSIPTEIYDSQSELDKYFTEDVQEKEIEMVYINGLINRRLKEFEETRVDVENNVIKTKEE